jgi:hypothetical protein
MHIPALTTLVIVALMAHVDAKQFKPVQDPTKYTGSNSPYPIPKAIAPGWTECGEGCELIQVQLLSRHGTRNPKKKELVQMDTLQRHVTQLHPGTLYPEFQWLTQFRVPFDKLQDGQLVQKGRQDLAALAQRDRIRYSPHLDQPSANSISFKASSTKRAQESGKAYMGSLFGQGVQPQMITTQSKEQDIELRPFSQCPRVIRDKQSPNVVKLLNDSKLLYNDKIAKHISQRIFTSGSVWPTNLIKPAYQMCQYETAFQGFSGWCQLFSKWDLEKLEYKEDYKAWYTTGPGAPVNKHITCPLLTTMFTEMQQALNHQPSAKKFSLRFAHAQTVMAFVATLGLYDGILSESSSRKFKVNQITPFAANVRLEVWKKNQGVYIRAMINEVPVVLPGCKYEFCSFDAFLHAQQANVNCDFKQLCA